jgi:uncharacterized membrane protein
MTADTACTRIESVDLVRGLVIVLMALDHTRDFFGDLAADPTAMATTTPGLFFIRWITHLCAPAFFLLTGIGAALSLAKKSKPGLAFYLVSRGLWLIFLELVVIRFALQFNIDYQVTIVTVLWALGWAMIVLAGLLWLPLPAIAAFGLLLVAGHNLLDVIAPGAFGALAPLWSVLHAPGVVFNDGRHVVSIAYVLIPWVGVTALGFCLGQAFRGDAARRKALLLWLGTGCIAAFLALRLLGIYGDPVPWTAQETALRSLMSFLNATKYPPSLLFLLMTLGPTLLLLRAFDGRTPDFFRPALVIGAIPLFFYVLHFFLIHLLAVLASWLRYGDAAGLFRSPDLAHFPFTEPPGWGEPLPVIYAVWIGVVLLLYPLCRRYAGVKRHSKAWWLGYL